MVDIKILMEKQREYFCKGSTLSYEFRMDRLNALENSVRKYEREVIKALYSDLNKSEFEAYTTEVGLVYEEIVYFKRNLKKWMRAECVRTPIAHFLTRSRIYREPFGNVLIMSPWNYPFQLSIIPLIGAVAGGNCAIVKPSNYSVNTSEVVKRIIENCFEAEHVYVLLGGRDENSALLEQKFDYIFFTGSTDVGRLVMNAAAKNLTPVTLELGGKSPCIIDETAVVDLAAKRIVWGKYTNAGQTCVAPDYVLVHSSIKDEFLRCACKWVDLMYSDMDIFPKIINKKHYIRLKSLIRGDIVKGGRCFDESFKIEPTIIEGVTWEDELMKNEIFGPVLPVLTYDDADEIIAHMQKMPKPLSLYLFTSNSENERKFISSLRFGGGCINDALIHVSSKLIPFGGVGESGVGCYHGKYSFDTFTRRKSIMKKSNAFDINLRYPFSSDKLNIIRKIMK